MSTPLRPCIERRGPKARGFFFVPFGAAGGGDRGKKAPPFRDGNELPPRREGRRASSGERISECQVLSEYERCPPRPPGSRGGPLRPGRAARSERMRVPLLFLPARSGAPSK